MPTYEYRCKACGSRFEEFQKMSDDPIESCPECGEPEAERLMSAGAGLVFKGSGFYETDYKEKGDGRTSGSGNGNGSSASSADAAEGASTGDSGDGGEGES